MIKTLFATALLSFSVGAKSIDHREAVTNNQATYVNGVYNLKNEFQFNTGDFSQTEYTIQFEDITQQKSFVNPISCYLDTGVILYYVASLTFDLSDSHEIGLEFTAYNNYEDTSFGFRVGDGDSLNDIDTDYTDLIVQFRGAYTLIGDEADLFNLIFTHEDNIYTTTYNGYYSMSNNANINNIVGIFGAISFNQYVYTYVTNRADDLFFDYQKLNFGYFDVTTDMFQEKSYYVPFDKNYVYSNNLLISNGKMTLQTYQRLSTYGVFAYERDTSYDDSDWKDLLFSVMDSPIYMISRLLNFEIFGINLYIALAGLLTIVVIVFCVRKFL